MQILPDLDYLLERLPLESVSLDLERLSNTDNPDWEYPALAC